MAKVPSFSAAQLVLFELEDRSQSHLIALYDLVPRFVFVTRDNARSEAVAPATKDQFVKSINRDFTFDGRTYYLTMQPARVYRTKAGKFGASATPEQARDLVEVEVFPSEREQIVEQVVRRLAMDRSRLSLVGEKRDKVQMRFSLYEIRRELRAVNHTWDYTEIREALTILARSRIIISKTSDGDGGRKRSSNLLDSTAFPQMAVRSRPDIAGDDEGEEETYLEFNALVSAAIRDLEFKPVSYEWLMRLKSPVSRWLYNRLSAQFSMPVGVEQEDDGVKAVAFSADDIIKNSGMNEWSRRRDTLRAVTAAVDQLVEEGILENVEKVYDKTGKRIDGIDYVMMPSVRFLEQVRKARNVREVNATVLKTITGSESRPDGFVPLTPAEALEARSRRSKKLAHAEAQPKLRLDDGP